MKKKHANRLTVSCVHTGIQFFNMPFFSLSLGKTTGEWKKKKTPPVCQKCWWRGPWLSEQASLGPEAFIGVKRLRGIKHLHLSAVQGIPMWSILSPFKQQAWEEILSWIIAIIAFDNSYRICSRAERLREINEFPCWVCRFGCHVVFIAESINCEIQYTKHLWATVI